MSVQPGMASRRSVLWAVLRRDVLLMLSYRFELVIRYAMAFLTVLFLYYLGGFVQARGMPGTASYFSFTLIGYSFSQLFGVVLAALSRRLREDQLMGTIEPLMGGGAAPGWLALASSVVPMLERLGIAGLQLALALALGADFHRADWPGVVLFTLVGALSLLGFSILSAAFVVVFKRGDPVVALLAAGSFLFTGVFFPIQKLPWVLRWVSYGLPITYGIRGVRGCIFEGLDPFGPQLRGDLLVLVGLTVILLPLGLWAFDRAVRRGRRTGTLCHY